MENLTIRPTEAEVLRWLTDTVKHSCRVEWLLHRLGIYNSDPQRPHDLEGKGNKLEPEMVMRFALEYQLPKTKDLTPGSREYIIFNKFVKPAIDYHRENQNHHRAWEGLDLEAKDEDMRIGAVDTIVAMGFEERRYQQLYTLAEIKKDLENHQRKGKWIRDILETIHDLSLEPLQVIANLEINSLRKLTDFGLPASVCDNITDKLYCAVKNLREQHKYMINDLKIS